MVDESSGERIERYLPGAGDNAALDPSVDTLPTVSHKAAHICGVPVSTQRMFLRALRGHAALTTFDTVVIQGQIEPSSIEIEELLDCSDFFLLSINVSAALCPTYAVTS